MVLLREAVGHTLRGARTSQSRTLRDVAREARVSLGYLSEVERGQKEASSELLNAICEALGLTLSSAHRCRRSLSTYFKAAYIVVPKVQFLKVQRNS
jgi:transcriptional regulator with XRE-family HTH domain